MLEDGEGEEEGFAEGLRWKLRKGSYFFDSSFFFFFFVSSSTSKEHTYCYQSIIRRIPKRQQIHSGCRFRADDLVIIRSSSKSFFYTVAFVTNRYFKEYFAGFAGGRSHLGREGSREAVP